MPSPDASSSPATADPAAATPCSRLLVEEEPPGLDRADASIMGGTAASPTRYPYVIGIFLPGWNGRGCGGVMLTKRVVSGGGWRMRQG